MNLTPLRDYVILEAPKAKSTTDSGIILVSTADMEPTQVTTVYAAPSFSPLTGDVLHPGDKVLFKPYSFDEIGIGGKKYLYGKQDGIVALLS